MKFVVKKSFNLFCIFAILVVAMFCFANFNGVANQSGVAFSEGVQEVVTSASAGADISSYASWEDFVEMPSVENLGSVDKDAKHVVVSNAKQLAWVAEQVNSGSTTYGSGFSSWTIELDADISLAGKIWTSIGASDVDGKRFAGTFIGNGHYIEGLTFLTSSSNGLFRYCSDDAVISDVIIKNCVNVKDCALVGGNSGWVVNSAAVGVSISNCNKYHVISNGEPINSWTYPSDSDKSPIGVDEFYYELNVYDETGANKYSDFGINSGKEIYFEDIGVSNISYKTISKVEISEFKIVNDDGFYGSWDIPQTFEASNDEKLKSYSSFSFEPSSGHSRRTCEKNAINDFSLLYAHQNAVKISIYLANRKVEVSHNVYAFQGTSYESIENYYKGARPSSDAVSLIADSYLEDLPIHVNNSYITSKTLTMDYGSELAYKYTDASNQYADDIYGIAQVSDFGDSGFVASKGWMSKNSTFTVKLDTYGNRVSISGNKLVATVEIYINNINIITIARSNATLDNNVVKVGNGSTTAYFYTNVGEAFGNSGIILSNEMQQSVTTTTGETVATMYVSNATDAQVKDKSMGNTYVFVSEGALGEISETQCCSISSLGSKLSDTPNLLGANGATSFVAGWVLNQVTVTLSATGIDSVLISTKNPYNGLTSEPESLAGNHITYATFVATVYSTALSNRQTLVIEKTEGDSNNSNIYEYYNNTRLEDVGNNVSPTKKQDSQTGLAPSHGVEIFLFAQNVSYSLTKEDKQVKFNITIVFEGDSNPTENVTVNGDSYSWTNNTIETKLYSPSGNVIEWTFKSNVTKQYRIDTSSGKYGITSGVGSISVGSVTNNGLTFSAGDLEGVENGATVSWYFTLVAYTNGFTSEIYDKDVTDNELTSTLVVKNEAPAQNVNETFATITAQVKYLTFYQLIVDGVTYYVAGDQTARDGVNNMSSTYDGQSGRIELVLANNGGTITIEISNDDINTANKAYQNVVITFDGLEYKSTNRVVKLYYMATQYEYEVSVSCPDGTTKTDTYSFDYNDKISSSIVNNTTPRVTIGGTNYDYNAYGYYKPDMKVEEKEATSVLATSLEPSLEIKYTATGITIKFESVDEITGLSINNGSIIYTGRNAISAPSYNFHTLTWLAWDDEGTSKVSLSDITYYTLSRNTLVSNGEVTIYAKFAPITYTIKFSGKAPDGTAAGIETTATFATSTKLSECVYSQSGYTTTVGGFTLENTLGEVVQQKGDRSKESTITLAVTYPVKGVTIKFIYNGITYASIDTGYDTAVSWSDLVADAEVELRKVNLVAESWAYGDTPIATYSRYNSTKQCFDYTLQITDNQSLKSLGFAYDENYAITATCRSTALNVTFDGSYIGGEQTTTVGFGTSTYADTVPTPTRSGYTFAYWKAVDSEGKEWVIKGSQGTTSIITTSDSSLTFYAYWNVNDITWSYSNYSAAYDGEAHDICITANVPADMASVAALTCSNDDATTKTGTGTITATLSNSKYAGTYSFTATFTYQYSATGAAGKAYILNADSYTTATSNSATATISKKTLTVETITKTYDGDTVVQQPVEGVFAADIEAGYIVSGAYETSHAGAGIKVAFSASGATEAIRNSYAIPSGKTGTITQKTINVAVSGNISYNGNDTTNIIIAKGLINADGVTISESNATVVVTNESDVVALLAGRTLTFVIDTNGKSSAGTYAKTNLNVASLVASDKTNDFEISITSSTFEIKALASGYMTFDFFARVYDHDEEMDVSALNVENYVASVSSTTQETRQITNYKFNVTTKVATNSTVKFVLVVSYKDANWWLHSATFVDRKTGAETVVNIGLYGTKTNTDYTQEIEFTSGSNLYYDVYLEFTNVSKVSFEVGGFTKGITDQPSTSYVQYNKKYVIPSAAVTGLTFDGWFYVDGSGKDTNLSVGETTWNIKGDVTLYALWTYGAVITIEGADISATYNPATTHTFKATNDNTSAPLTYSYKWQYCKTSSGTYANKIATSVSPCSVTVKNVADSGYYQFVFGITNPKYSNGKECVITLSVKYKYDGSENTSAPKYSATISKANLTLKNAINKSFDGEATLAYTIAAADIDKAYNEIIGQSIIVTYNSAIAGATACSVSELDNYTFAASGKISKRELTINIGTQKYEYNEGVQTYNPKDITLSALYSYSGSAGVINIKQIAISTNSANTGVYNQQSGNITISFSAILAKDGKTSAAKDNFDVTVTGDIVIYAKPIGEIKVGNSKVYNAQVQSPDVFIFGNETPLNQYYSVKYNGEWIIENGVVTTTPNTNAGGVQALCDVGSYDIEIVVSYPNYASETIATTLTITTFDVYVEVVKSNISKVYDGSAVLESTYLAANTDYYLYSDTQKTALSDTFKTDIANFESVVFTFDDANVGTNKPISIYAEGNPNYSFTLINKNLKGSITKKNITLTVSAGETKVYNEDIFTVLISKGRVQASGLASSENLAGSFTIAVIEAGSYNLTNGTYTPNVGEATTLINYSLANYYDFSKLTIGTKSVLDNYTITGVSGTIVINKANIELKLNPIEYIYTGAVQEVGYKVTRTIDNEDVTEIVEITDNTGINVGTHAITFAVKDEYQNNYNDNLSAEGYEFTINKKVITLTVEETRAFNGNIFKVVLNQVQYNKILCTGHNFGDSYVATIYTYAYTYNYEDGMLNTIIKVYDAENEEVTSNYTITYDLTLTIGKMNLNASHINAKSDYVYNNTVQLIVFTVYGINVNFAGNVVYATTPYETTSIDVGGGDVKIYTTFSRIAGTNSYENTEFKYAGTYKISMTSNIFNNYSFEMKISPKTITTFEITYDGKTYETANGDVYTRQYDGTDEIYANIVSSDIYENDASYVMLDGKLSGEFGDITIPVKTFKYNFPNSWTESRINQVKGSYVIASNLSMNAKITAREVTLTYVGTDSYYYTSKRLILSVNSMFSADNMVSGESFGGQVEFRGIVNANTYDLATEGADVNISALTITEGSKVSYYNISYVGTVVINKAQIIVSKVENNNVTYSDTAKEVLLTASIYSYRGEIVAGNEQALLYADYALAPGLDFVEAIDVANYYIYPFVTETYFNNYEYVGNDYLTDKKLIINQKKVEVYTDKEVTYDSTRDEYLFDEIDVVIKEIVDGHTFEGTLTIALDKLETGKTYLYKTNEISEGVGVENFDILKNTDSVLRNYNVNYNITITIVDKVVDGGYRALAQELYVYSSENQISTVAFNFDIGLGGQIETTVIKKDSASKYAKIEGFYESLEDANITDDATRIAKQISSIVNVGEYYVRFLVDANGTSNYTSTPCYSRVRIIQKTISSFTYDGKAFTGTRVYTATTSSILESVDVYSADKDIVTITVTYYDEAGDEIADAGYGYVAAITIAGAGIGNYVLGITEMDGVIEKRVVTVTEYNDSTIYRYAGTQNITLDYTKFEIIGEVSGHTLIGGVTIEVTKAGEYKICEGTNAFGMMSVVDVSNNYKVEISKDLVFVMNKAEVTISWTEPEFTYNSMDRVAEIIENLTYTGDYIEGVQEDISLEFNSGVKIVKNAGSYIITKANSISSNFNYTIDVIDNIVIVSPKEILVDFGITTIKWYDYDQAGYNISYSMIDGAYIADIDLLETGKYMITLSNGETHRANTTYYAQAGTDLDETAIGPFHRYQKITVNFDAMIWNNYTPEFVGGFNIIPETLTFEDVPSFTYNSEDRFAEVVVAYVGEDGQRKEISETDTTYGVITKQYMEDAGDYILTVEINTALYNIPVTINVLPISIIEISKNKQYDGTNKVFNTSGSEYLVSPNMVDGDDLVITGLYADYAYSAEAYAITFSMTGSDAANYSLPQNYTGKINKRVILFNFGTWNLTYNVNNSYTIEYQGETVVTGGMVSQKVIKFSLNENKVKDKIEITDKTATIDSSEFVIVHDINGVDVTYCYDITFNIAITLLSKQFEITFNGFDGDKVVFDATEKQVTIAGVGLDENEVNLVLSNFTIKYKYTGTEDIFATNKYPINIGSYTAIAEYTGSTNYTLIGNNEYTFEILPYEFNVENADIEKITKEYAFSDPELKQVFTIKFPNAIYSFNVYFEREDGEAVGLYDLSLATDYIDTDNIALTLDQDALIDKFEITINKSNIVVIKIKSYNDGEFERYYGFKNIGLFNLSDFTYTTTLKGTDGRVVDGGISAGSTVLYNSGNVGTYVVNSCDITSTNFERFEVESEIDLEIKKRTLVISADSYDKVYDGTTRFISELIYDYNTVAEQGTLDEKDIEFIGEVLAVVTYGSSDVGTRGLTLELTTQTQNFNARLASATGRITPLKLLVNATSQTLTYGDEISLEYTVEYADTSIEQVFTYSELRSFVSVSVKDAILSTAGHVKAGTYNIYVTTTENFEIANEQTAVITVERKQITVIVTPKIFKVEDGLTLVDLIAENYSVETDGVIAGDIVTVPYAEFTNAMAGTNKVVSFKLDGADSSNYQALTVRGDIGQKLITFEFMYYGYPNCPVNANQINGSTTAITKITYDYYSSINAQNANSLPSPAFIGKGYQFVGWSTTIDSTGIIDPNTELSKFLDYSEKITVYAIWDIQKFDITLYSALYNFETNSYDVTQITTVSEYYLSSVDVGLYINAPAHYSYSGYGIGNTNNLYTSPYTIIDNVDLYLVYALDRHVVTFDSNGGVFTNLTSKFAYQSAGVATIETFYGQTIGDVMSSTLLTQHTVATKEGYSFNSWTISSSPMTIAEIANYQVNGDIQIAATWSANQYTLTLNGADGIFTLTEEQQNKGWSYVDAATRKDVQIQVAYNSNIPELVRPVKEFYTFDGYVDYLAQSWNESQNTIWTTLGGITLTATYRDSDFTLTIVAENATASIVAKDGRGVVIDLQNTSTTTGLYTYFVKTSYYVTITATVSDGYTFAGFNDVDASGIAFNNTYTITSFRGNPTVTIKTTANQNTITLKVNDNAFGYITSTINEIIYASNATSSFVLASGNSAIITAVPSEGYEVKEWYVDGTGTLSDLGGNRVLSGYTSDTTILVEFVPKALNIQIINEAEKGDYFYLDKDYVENQTFVVHTGDVFEFVVTPSYGYGVNGDALEFVTTSDNKGVLNYNITNDRYYVTLSNFTSDGSIRIVYTTKEFALTFGYAEYDETSGEIVKTDTNDFVVEVGGVQYKAGESVSIEFLSSVVISPKVTKTGYILYNYSALIDDNFVAIAGNIDAENAITITLDNNYELYVVYQREEYVVTYKINDSSNGGIRFVGDDSYSTAISETVRFGRTTTEVETYLADEYRTFEGWKDGEIVVATTLTLPKTQIQKATDFVAFVAGLSGQKFNVKIKANSTYEIADDINAVLSGENVVVGTATESVDANGNIVVIIPVTYNVGDELRLSIDVKDYYQANNGGVIGDNYDYNLGAITPAVYNLDTPLEIDLSLRYYEIKIVSDSEKAVLFTADSTETVGLGGNSNFNPVGTTIATAYVQYGGKLSLNMEVQDGYLFVGQAGDVQFNIVGNKIAMENITSNAVVTFNFARTQYKITFQTNYPTKVFEENLEGVVNKEFTFYIGQDESILKNQDGSTANISNLIASQTFVNSSGAVFSFTGWSIVENAGVARTYFFDDGGIYYISDQGVKTYGFNVCETIDLDNDGNADQEDGRIITNLYGSWTLPAYEITIEYAPSTITYDGEYGSFYNNTTGLLTSGQVRSAGGVKITMNAVPVFADYVYYGWKLKTDVDITTGYANFTMPSEAVVIVLYYQFYVEVCVEESILGANAATLNGENTGAWFIVGQGLQFVATAGEGFEFKQWTLNGATLDGFNSSFTIEASDKATYKAVFEGLVVQVALRDVSHTTVSWVQNVQGNEQVVAAVRVGDIVRVKIENVEYGYTLKGIAVNGSTDGVKKHTSGAYYEYTVKQSDGTNGIINIDSIVNTRNVNITFKTNISGSSIITVNNLDLTNLTQTYSYDDVINIVVAVQSRYKMLGVSINGVPIDNVTEFTKAVNQANGFSFETTNQVLFEFEKLYWIDVKQSLVGYGTKEAPYLIANAENLAYLAYIVNNGIIDQSLNRIYYKVTGDIDLSERFWIPIGTENNPFDGTFILGTYKITGASFAEKYEHFSWEEYCTGVFGYVTDNAKIIIEQSMLPTIIILVVVGVLIILIIAIIIIVINKRKKKMKRLSEKLTVTNVDKTKEPPKKPQVQQEEKSVSKEQMDAEVLAILNRARQQANDTDKK